MQSPTKLPSHNITFDHIVEMLKGHYLYLLRHQKYLQQIEEFLSNDNNNNNNNNEQRAEEIKDYIQNLFPGKKISLAEFYQDYLPELKRTLSEKLEATKKIMSVTKYSKGEQAICHVNYLLEIELEWSRYDQMLFGSKKVSEQSKIQTVFRNYNYLKRVHAELQPLLPEINKTFREIFSITKETRCVDVNNKGHMEMDFVLFDSCDLLAFVSFKTEIVTRKVKALNDFQTARSKLGCKSLILPDPGSEKDAEEPKKDNKDSQSQKQSKQAPSMEDFFALRERMDSICNKIDESTKTLNFYSEHVSKIKKDITNLKERCEILYKKIFEKKLPSDRELFAIQEKMVGIKVLIDKLESNFLECLNAVKTLTDLDHDIEIFYEFCTEAHECMDTLSEVFHSYTSALASKERQQQIESEEQEKNRLLRIQEQEEREKNRILKIQEENAESTRQRQEALRRYREQVNQRKLEKETQSQTTIPKKEDPKKDVVKYKNTTMGSLLAALSDKHLKRLKSLLNFETTVTYDEFFFLITNHLNGEVAEIGNGSSHKRIYLEKLYFEIVPPEDPDKGKSSADAKNPKAKRSKAKKPAKTSDSELDKASLATGGMFKPHGKNHNAGNIVGFNLTLVNDLLTKAGITLAVIEEIEMARVSELPKEESAGASLRRT